CLVRRRQAGAWHHAWRSTESPMCAGSRLALLRSLLVLTHEVEAGGINAIALPGRSWAIVEDMAQMAAAAAAPYLDPMHAIAEILERLDRSGFHIVKRGPATARIEFRLCGEQQLIAARTAVGPVLLQVPVFPSEGALGPGFAQNVLLLGR